MYWNLKIALIEKGITVDAVAKLLGVHRNTMAAKLKGASKISVEEIQKIRDAYLPEKSLDYLIEKK